MTGLLFRNQFYVRLIPATKPYHLKWKVRVTVGSDTFNLDSENYGYFSFKYHGETVHVEIDLRGGSIVTYGELEDWATILIDLHLFIVETVPILVNLVAWRPDMRDSWRELPKYLTPTK